MRSYRYICISVLLIITACGGDSKTTKSVDNTPQSIAIETEKVDLTGKAGQSLVSPQKVSGIITTSRVTINESFANAVGQLRHINTSANVEGNLTLGVTASDSDELTKVSLFLPSVNKSYSLCSNNCKADFQSTITGFNPQLANVSAGTLRIELVVEDSQGNSVIVDALTLDWQPLQITALSATRANGNILVSWVGNSSLQRYNLYAATQHGLKSSNALNLDNGVQHLAIEGTSFQFTDAALEKDYHLIVTGIDSGGESGLSAPFSIPKSDGIPNQAPQASQDDFELNEDSSFLANVLDNDLDPDGQLITVYNLLSLPSNGIAEVDESGHLTYHPDLNFNGEDSFIYQIIDTQGEISQAIVFLDVLPVNDSPLAVDDSYGVDINGAIQDSNLLINDTDIDGDGLVVLINPVEAPQRGMLTLNQDGSFIYQSNELLLENDQFSYQISDSNGGLATASVIIVPNSEAVSPISKNDTYQLDEDNTLVVSQVDSGILSNDIDPNGLTFELLDSLLSGPKHGQLNLSLDGTFTYIPDSDFFGMEQLQYQIMNSAGLLSQAFVTIVVNPIADTPIAADDDYQASEDSAISKSVQTGLLVNDVDPDNGVLQVNTTPVSAPQNGGVVLGSDGSFIYTPDPDFYGVDSFTYQILNESGLVNTATVNIAITTINDNPVATNDSYTFNEDTTLTKLVSNNDNLLANDSDVDGDSLTVNTTPVTNVKNGSLTLNNNGSFSYVPNTDFNGTDNFTYQINDGKTGTAQASVTLIVSGVNDAPVAVTDSYTFDEDITLRKLISDSDHLLSNDSDVDGDSLTVNTTPISTVSQGVLTLFTDGSFTYVPKVDFNGSDSFTYQISDGNGGIAQVNVDLTILAVNDSPTAINQSFSLAEDETDGFVVGTVAATDLESDNMSFALTGGDTALFNINSSSGVITVKGVTPLDYETSIQHSVTVTITDDGIPLTGSTVISVTINLTDIIESTFAAIPAFGPVPLELTGVKTQAKLTDSVSNGSKIYFVGNIDNIDKDIYMIAYDKDGTLDTGFGTGGKQTFDLGHQEYATSIVEEGGKYYIAFTSDDGTNTEICFMKVDNNGDIDTGFGSNGISCTAEQSKLTVNDMVYNGHEFFAVGSKNTGTKDLLVIQIDKNGTFIDHTPLDATDSPHIIQEVSGINQDDEGFSIYNPDSDDVLIAGTVTTAAGDKDMFAWLLDKNGVEINTFNGGNAQFYDVSGTDDEVFAVGGKSEGSFTAHMVGSTVLGNGVKEAVIIAINETSALAPHFGGTGIVTYDVDGDGGAGTGYAEFTAISHDGSELYVSGTLFDTQNKPFATRIFEADGSIDTVNFGDVNGYRKISYNTDNAFALSATLDGDETMWIPGYVESSSDTNMIISAVDKGGVLCNINCENDFGPSTGDGKETFIHSSLASDDNVTTVVKIQNSVQKEKYLVASVANDATTNHIVLTRFTNDGALDTSFDSDGHKQIQIGSSAEIKGIFELPDGKFILYGNVTEATGTNGFIAQLDHNANFDINFATNGVYTTSAITATNITLVQATKDSAGNVVAVGSLESGSIKAFVIRLTSTGVIDTNFDGSGYVIGNSTDEYNSLLVDGNDIFAAGSRTSTFKDMLVIKYLANGMLDTSFNTTGVLIVDVNPAFDDYIEKLKFDTSNNLYLVGNNEAATPLVSIVRVLANGMLDTSFSGNGINSFILSSTPSNSGVKDAVIDTINGIYVVGFSDVSGTNKGMIGYIKADGTLDLTFATNGFFEATASCANAAQLNSVILLNNSSLVVAGQCYTDATLKNDIEISNYQIN